jgi:hypothetical protein
MGGLQYFFEGRLRAVELGFYRRGIGGLDLDLLQRRLGRRPHRGLAESQKGRILVFQFFLLLGSISFANEDENLLAEPVSFFFAQLSVRHRSLSKIIISQRNKRIMPLHSKDVASVATTFVLPSLPVLPSPCFIVFAKLVLIILFRNYCVTL